MSSEKRPAFQFYPKDFLMDEHVRLMDYAQRGLYITLLSLCWVERSLPAGVADLAKIVNLTPAQFQKLWRGPLSQCFRDCGNGRMGHKRLDEEREKQERFSRRQSEAVGSRWRRNADTTVLPESDTTVLPSLYPREEDRRLKIEDQKEDPEEEALGKRAAHLLERYSDWYRQYRNGASIRLLHNGIEFSDACSLCRLWDDVRLEKLAALVLTTNDAFVAGTDRGFKIFALKASWADDKLRQWERSHGVTA